MGSERVLPPPVVHRYGCDCEECWIGYSVNAPEPPSRWQRIIAALRSTASRDGQQDNQHE